MRYVWLFPFLMIPRNSTHGVFYESITIIIVKEEWGVDRKVMVILCVGVFFAATAVSSHAQQGGEVPQWKVRTELSYTNSSGNSDSETLAAKVGVKREEELNRYYLDGSVFKTENDSDETANRWVVDGRYERVIRDRLFGFGEAYYIKDKFSGYKYRYGFGPGVGYDFIRTDNHSLKGLFSILYSYDRYSIGTEASDDYFAGKAGIKYKWRIMENLTFGENAYYLFSFDDADQYFLNSETTHEVKISDMVSLGVSYIIAYQNEPPSPLFDDTDRIFLTSLIVDF